jgi:hypothetical protein
MDENMRCEYPLGYVECSETIGKDMYMFVVKICIYMY